MRYLYLYTSPGSYTAAVLRALVKQANTELLLVHYPTSNNAPLSDECFSGIPTLCVSPKASHSELMTIYEEFKPDVLLISGWIDKRYLKIARHARRSGVLTIAGSDTQWRGSARQLLARFIAPSMLKPAIDVLWVPGCRQKTLAMNLGYRNNSVWDGHLCCDWDKFCYPEETIDQFSNRDKAFIFSGRLVEEKGLSTLLLAYKNYRKTSKEPWELWCAGTGPLASMLSGMDGVSALGFLQVNELAALMKKASAFILPSHFEPWGLVVQEAAAAGLPLILSHEVGAGEHLLRDGFNGFSTTTGNVNSLTDAMLRIESMEINQRYTMGRKSYQLSCQYLPGNWASKLVRESELRLKKQ